MDHRVGGDSKIGETLDVRFLKSTSSVKRQCGGISSGDGRQRLTNTVIGDNNTKVSPRKTSITVKLGDSWPKIDEELNDNEDDEKFGGGGGEEEEVEGCVGCFDLNLNKTPKSSCSPPSVSLASRTSSSCGSSRSRSGSVGVAAIDNGQNSVGCSSSSSSASSSSSSSAAAAVVSASNTAAAIVAAAAANVDSLAVSNAFNVSSINNNNVEMPDFIVDSKTRVTYLKGKFLGKGGFAHVHLVTDLTTDRSYAGKIIAKSRITKRHHMEKITREIELQSTLKHENVVRFYHFFEDHLNVYIILENCDRMSLAHELKRRRRLSEEESRYYMWQLVEGVQYIHSQKVIHRDLKLGNMFLTKEFLIKIGDFGLATRHDTNVESKVTICGTPNYIAPEVLKKEGHVFASDLWSLGCSMYAMMVGFPPFETTSLKETYVKILTNDYAIPPLISDSARRLIVSLLHQTPEARPSLEYVRRFPFFVDHFSQHYQLTKMDGSTYTLRFPNRGSSTTTTGESCCIDSVSIVGLGDGIPRPKTREIQRLSKAVTNISINRGMEHCCKASTLKNDRTATKGSRSTKESPANMKDTRFAYAIRKKISSVLCPDRSFSSKKQNGVLTATLFHALNTCIDNMPDGTTDNPPPLKNARVLYIVKWIDYSNRYGFGFQLSDHSVGVHFNDSTRMSFSSDKSRIEFLDECGNVTTIVQSAIPTHLQERFTLLRYFCQYMDENLTDGGDAKGMVGNRRSGHIPYMKRWLRTSRAVIMQLSTGTLQINFFQDHTKVILGLEKNEFLVTYINEDRIAFTYKLLQIADVGCDVHLRNRLLYALNVLGEFSSLDNNIIPNSVRAR